MSNSPLIPVSDPPEIREDTAAAVSANTSEAVELEDVTPAAPVEPTTAPADSLVAGEPAYFWLRRGDQVVLAVLVAISFSLMVANWARLSGWGTRPVEIKRLEQHRFEYKVDINSATWVEWIQLDGIGEVLARRIVDDRKQNGRFHNIDDLQRVHGIGPKTIERLRPWLKVSAVVND